MLFLSKTNKYNYLAIYLAVFVVAELLSWLSFSFDKLSLLILILLALFTVVMGFIRPVYLLLIPIAELVWGSLGHSFEYDLLNVRLVIFIAVLFTFILRYLFKMKEWKFFKDKVLATVWLFIILIFIAGLASAYYKDWPWQNIFLDANAYIYLLYLPIWYQVYQKDYLEQLLSIIKAAAIVVATKTLILFNIFSQNYFFLDNDFIYKWVRDTRTGEITPFDNNFSRIFLQSQFYVLIAWFLVWLQQIKDYRNRTNLVWLVLLSSSLLISLSRSFWLGGAVALVFLLINIFLIQNRRLPIGSIVILVSTLFSSIITIQIFFNLPHWNSFNVFTQRTTDSSEPAANSRMQLLNPLWQEVSKQIIIGHGFGKEITYQSSDPRIKNENNPEGWYTTYAFEWGWLDMWLKAGLLFVLAFVWWILLIFKRGYTILMKDPIVVLMLLGGLTALVVIHIFSPYVNHPLGLGLLMLATVIFSNYGKKVYNYR